MMKRIALWVASIAILALLPACTHATDPTAPRFDAEQRAVMNSEGFLSAHPDLRWRREAMRSLEAGRGADALAQFKRAARYADKPSQAMIAEMLWTGRGVAVDRPLAYAWMDIAAERAYVPFVAKREQYWAALSADERRMALQVGRPLYDEYNDAVAKPRLERVLEEAKRDITGSRTGFVGNLRVIIPGPGGVGTEIDAEHYYADEFWEPEQYWALQDAIWKDPPSPVENVQVRPLQRILDEAETDTPSPADDDTP